MQVLKTFCLAVLISILVAACSSAERRASRSQVSVNKSQTELNERKMKIVDEYEKCVEKSSGEEELARCEAKLKGAEGL
jgi:uncharacterized protein YcfL